MEKVTVAERTITFREFDAKDMVRFMDGWELKGYDRTFSGDDDRWLFMKTIGGALRLFDVDKVNHSVRLRTDLEEEGLEMRKLTQVFIDEKSERVVFSGDSGQYEISHNGMSHKTVKKGVVGTFDFGLK